MENTNHTDWSSSEDIGKRQVPHPIKAGGGSPNQTTSISPAGQHGPNTQNSSPLLIMIEGGDVKSAWGGMVGGADKAAPPPTSEVSALRVIGPPRKKSPGNSYTTAQEPPPTSYFSDRNVSPAHVSNNLGGQGQPEARPVEAAATKTPYLQKLNDGSPIDSVKDLPPVPPKLLASAKDPSFLEIQVPQPSETQYARWADIVAGEAKGRSPREKADIPSQSPSPRKR